MCGKAARNMQTRTKIHGRVRGFVVAASPRLFLSKASATINPATAWPTGLGMSAVHNDFSNEDWGFRRFAIHRCRCDFRHHVHAANDAAEDCIEIVETPAFPRADEERCGGATGVVASRHRQDAGHVRRVCKLWR